jgi:hypothetical protein
LFYQFGENYTIVRNKQPFSLKFATNSMNILNYLGLVWLIGLQEQQKEIAGCFLFVVFAIYSNSAKSPEKELFFPNHQRLLFSMQERVIRKIETMKQLQNL